MKKCFVVASLLTAFLSAGLLFAEMKEDPIFKDISLKGDIVAKIGNGFIQEIGTPQTKLITKLLPIIRSQENSYEGITMAFQNNSLSEEKDGALFCANYEYQKENVEEKLKYDVSCSMKALFRKDGRIDFSWIFENKGDDIVADASLWMEMGKPEMHYGASVLYKLRNNSEWGKKELPSALTYGTHLGFESEDFEKASIGLKSGYDIKLNFGEGTTFVYVWGGNVFCCIADRETHDFFCERHKRDFLTIKKGQKVLIDFSLTIDKKVSQ